MGKDKSDDIELQAPVQKLSPSVHEDPYSGSDLPPVDRGKGAWAFLIAATCLEILVWGFANSYGVFLDHYNRKYPDSTAILPVAGTIANGEMYLLLGPFTFFLHCRPRLRAHCTWAGLVIMTAGNLGAAFSTNARAIIITQGVLYGLGGTMLYTTASLLLFEWWQHKRGLAAGIMLSGTGVGGLVMPFICAALLDHFGQRTTLISIAIGYAIILAIVIPFVRPRIPVSSRYRTATPKIDWSFARHLPFWMLWLGVLCQGLAAFMPGTYLPAYASALKLSPGVGTLSVALMNLARVPGQILIGFASDKIGARTLVLVMSVASSLSVLTGWGLAHDAGGLLGFAIAFGWFAGSYTALFTRFIRAISQDDPSLSAMIYGLFFFARGIGSIASGPVSSALLTVPSKGVHLGATGWGPLILWTGAGMIGSGLGAGYKSLKRD